MKYLAAVLLLLIPALAYTDDVPTHNEWTTIRLDTEQSYNIWQIYAHSNGDAQLNFLYNGLVVGQITWHKNGRVRFYGNIDQSARALAWRVSEELGECVSNCGQRGLRGD